MKPIEEGCRAMIINSINGNNGKIVTVGSYAGQHPEFPYSVSLISSWEISPSLIARYEESGRLTKESYAQEYNLMRIDGFEESESSETKQKELVK